MNDTRVPAGRAPGDGVPAGQVPAGQVPAGQVPAGQVPVAEEVEALLRTTRRGGVRRGLLWSAGALMLAALAVVWLAQDGAPALRYLTEPVRRDHLIVYVTATGALQPTNQVDVGTEISGTIESVAVDFNDHVAAGQVLARLDTDRLEATVAQSEASLAVAAARLAEARATAEEARLRLERLERIAELGRGELISQEDFTTARAAMDRAEAGIASARATITEAEARLSSDRANLGKAIIRAPIDGVVLSRLVEPGQTVAASLQTPVLFRMAESLAQMELRVAVDEADVGEVQAGQSATFTVAAYADREFPATIRALHFAPTTTAEGVVTYEAVLTVANDDLLLRPGMTATADIVVAQRDDVLVVPSAALRFEPPAVERNQGFQLMPSHPGRSRRTQGPAGSRVWVLQAGEPVPVPVTTGASDQVTTEILAGVLQVGQPVVVDYVTTGGH